MLMFPKGFTMKILMQSVLHCPVMFTGFSWVINFLYAISHFVNKANKFIFYIFIFFGLLPKLILSIYFLSLERTNVCVERERKREKISNWV